MVSSALQCTRLSKNGSGYPDLADTHFPFGDELVQMHESIDVK